MISAMIPHIYQNVGTVFTMGNHTFTCNKVQYTLLVHVISNLFCKHTYYILYARCKIYFDMLGMTKCFMSFMPYLFLPQVSHVSSPVKQD